MTDRLTTGIQEAGTVTEVEDEERRSALLRQMLFPDSSPIHIGRFVLEERIGAGAMGTVYRGRDEQLDRPIAIKVLRETARGSDHRLLREARGLARLTHPNVVTVYEVGQVDDQFYIAMEYIEGDTLESWQVDRSIDECLDAYRAAGRGLAAVHETGLIHRDFKPANVLVGTDERVRVADFGLVRSDDQDEATSATPGSHLNPQLTAQGELVGTPAYMAPEQLVGGTATQLSDQFSFCAALFESLTGARPFTGESIHELVEAMKGPPKCNANQMPSWLLEALTTGLSISPEDRFLDMNALLAAMEGPPAAQLSNLQKIALAVVGIAVMVGANHYLRQRDAAMIIPTGETLNFVQEISKLVKTDPTTAALLVLEADSPPGWNSMARRVLSRPIVREEFKPPQLLLHFQLSADGVLTGYDLNEELWQRTASGFEKATTERLRKRRQDAARELATDAETGQRIDQAFQRFGHSHSAALLTNGTIRWRTPDKITEWSKADEIVEIPIDFEDPRVYLGSTTLEPVVWVPNGDLFRLVSRSPPEWSKFRQGVAQPAIQGNTLVTADKHGVVSQFQNEAWRELPSFPEPLRTLTPSQNGVWVVGVTSKKRRVRVWRVDDEPSVWDVPGSRYLTHPVFLQSNRLALIDPTQGVVMWDLVNQRSIALSRPGADATSAVEGPDQNIVTTTADSSVQIWSTAGALGKTLSTHPDAAIWSAATDPSGRYLASAGTDGTVHLIDLRGNEETRILGKVGNRNFYHTLFSPDGRWLAAGAHDGKARIWRVEGGNDEEPLVLEGHAAWAYALAFSPDSEWLVTGDQDGVVRKWSVKDGRGERLGQHPLPKTDRRIHTLTYDPEGKFVVSGSKNGTILLFPTNGGKTTSLNSRDFNPVVGHDYAGRLMSAGTSGFARQWNSQGEIIREFTIGTALSAWAFAPDREHVAFALIDRQVQIWNHEANVAPIAVIPPSDKMSEALAFDAASERLAIGDRSGTLRIVDRNGAELWRFQGHQGPIRFVTFSDGDAITASSDGTIRRWRTPVATHDLRALIQQRTRMCLTTGQRRRFLGEDISSAQTKADACLASRKTR